MRRTQVFILIFAVVPSFWLGCGSKRSSAPSRSSYTVTARPARPTLPPLPDRPLSTELEAKRVEAMRRVAELRGLAWLRDVPMTELFAWEYGPRNSEMAKYLGGDDLRALGRLAVAGGMLPEGTDLATLAASFTAVSAGANYSPLDKRVLLVTNQAHTPSLLAHEYVHALQDQHFDLLHLLTARPYSFDRAEAVFAVIEGDAMNVQRRLENGDAYTRRSLDEIMRQEDERLKNYRREMGELFPPLLIETFIFRYRDGARFVEEIRRKKGQSGVDELFRQPPASSEQILHPEKYLAREAPREATVDEGFFSARGWHLITDTPLGEIGIRGLLLAALAPPAAARAAYGWGGDRAYLFERDDGSTLFVWQTVWDSRRDAEEFFRAYNALCQRTAERIDSSSEQTLWRGDGRATWVRLQGDGVLILRGDEAEVRTLSQAVRG
ncbi:MAG: hypothetical protein C4334_13670 [Pyrinomonas sp.]|uniref:hypothetical protein n=1 Tax=Pyrinomonas sp. TaxID=2080306 RepID=UPI00332A1A3B